MFDRIRLAIKVLFSPHIIVVTEGEQFSTFDGANIHQDSRKIIIDVVLNKGGK